MQPCLVAFHEVGGEVFEGEVDVAPVFHQAADSLLVGTCAACFTIGFQCGNPAVHVGEEGVLGCVLLLEGGDDVIGCVGVPFVFQLVDYLLQLTGLPLCFAFDGHEFCVALAPLRWWQEDAFPCFVPFLWQDGQSCVDLSDYSVVDDLKIKAAFLALHGGCSELKMYGCHLC